MIRSMSSMNLNPIIKVTIAVLLVADLVRAAPPNFIVVQPDDFYFFEEWGPPAHFDGRNSLQQFPPNSDGLPNINRIRKGGLHMKNAYAASALCGTSRYSTITGRYPSRSAYGRVWDEDNFLRDVRIPATKLEDVRGVDDPKDCSENNIAALLQRNGYKTGVTGKWHLTSDDGGAYTYGKIQSDVRGCGFDFAEAIYKENLWGNWYGDATHNMEHVTSEAFKFIEEAVQEESKPFFLYFNPTVPHSSGDVTDALQYADCRDTVGGRLNNPPSIRYGMTADFGGDCRAYRQSVLERGGRNDDKLAGAVWVDDAIGSLFQLLENLGIVDNTFFLFQLDHGESTKGSLFEGGTRIPQFIHYPDLFSRGSTFEGLVSTIDIAATIADVAGVPQNDLYAMDGKSWKSEIVNGNNNWSRGNDRCLFFEEGLDRSVRCGCYKTLMIENRRTGFTVEAARTAGVSLATENFYNLCDDAGLYINAPEVSPEVRSASLTSFLEGELTSRLDCHLSKTNPMNAPNYDTTCDGALDGFDGVSVATPSAVSTPNAVPTWPPIPVRTQLPTRPFISSPHRAPSLSPIPSPTRLPTRSPTLKPPVLVIVDEDRDDPWEGVPWADNRPPTPSPTIKATRKPTKVPTLQPTPQPSRQPTKMPTIIPIPVSAFITEAPTASPESFETSNETDIDFFDDFNSTVLDAFDSGCDDDIDYLYNEIGGQDCQWVIQNDRCDRQDPETKVHIGKVFCPASCSYCQDEDDCLDNANYQWYGRIGFDCAWLAENERCDSVRDSANGTSVHIGRQYCSQSCGYCTVAVETINDVEISKRNEPV